MRGPCQPSIVVQLVSPQQLDNVVRFIRNWKQLFDTDRRLKLVIGLSANDTEYQEVNSLLAEEFNFVRKASNQYSFPLIVVTGTIRKSACLSA